MSTKKVKIFEKIFQKPIDKGKSVCYNQCVPER